MKRLLIVLVAALPFGGTQAYAQDTPGPAVWEVTAIPGGGTFFRSQKSEPSFGNYDVGGALTYRLNRLVSVEGELDSSLGVTQDLTLGGVTAHEQTPNMFGYTGNVVFTAPTHHRTSPYITGGVGGLTVFQRERLGVNNTDTLLTGNVGAGIKWYANTHWGIRGDYRFMAVRSATEAATFFGQDRRYGNRIYGGVVVNLMG